MGASTNWIYRALGALSLNTAPTRVSRKAPSNETEFALLEIWQRLLQVDALSVDDDFFDAGGTSLQAMRLFSQIRSRFGKQLWPVRLRLWLYPRVP